MKFTFFYFLIFCFNCTIALAQYTISGVVLSTKDSSALKECSVYLNGAQNIAITDNSGRFSFPDIPNGNYVLYAVGPNFKHTEKKVVIAGQNQFVSLMLDDSRALLGEVIITEKQTDFGFSRMSSVENLGIYEGKKSEVISPDQLVANTATNNARQVYSRVAGLNIWENDGAGLQLSIGGRGLDPNRSSNFNVRQNGYDISADALGYPESYYTPPLEAVSKIQIVRGAASLQYGTQFGGLINFVMKKPNPIRKIDLTARQSIGSFGFTNSFISASGTVGKLSYYTFLQYKQGGGWRSNSHFNNHTFFSNVNYQATKKATVGIDLTQMGYLAQQPGGLTDLMFKTDPRQTNRERNWFKVGWNLLALHFDHKFNIKNEFNMRLFGLSAYRYSVGFRPNRIATIDDNSERDLIKGNFTNWGLEARYLKRYSIGKMPSVLLTGTRYYQGLNESVQGLGSKTKDADFTFVNPDQFIIHDYKFPNRNISFFSENIFNLHEKFSVTPGLRYEYINTTAEGFYGTILRDLAGNVLNSAKTYETRNNSRQFLLGGLGLSYKPFSTVNIYSNISQNYRSITFSDMRISNPSSVIDPDMKDEKGYSIDLGIRSMETVLYNYDVSIFYLNYNNRIGEIQFYDQYNRVLRMRSNIGQAIIQGIETYAEVDLLKVSVPQKEHWSGVLFGNIAFITSTYKASKSPGIAGNKVEFVPDMNLKSGIRLGYKKLKASFQFTYLSEQFSDATNARDGGISAVIGVIPAYSIMDVSLSYEWKRLKIESSINNLADQMYFTRRATGYPGPGIIPSDGRCIFITLQVKI